MKKSVVGGVLLCCSFAWAGFTVTNPGPVDSNGDQNEATNGVFTFDYSGPDFRMADLVFSGDVTSGGIGSFIRELRIGIQDPTGQELILNDLAIGSSWSGTRSIGPLTYSNLGNSLAGTAGTYTFTFFEDYDDDYSDVDATWTNLSFDFQGQVPQYLSDYAVTKVVPGHSVQDNNGNYQNRLSGTSGWKTDGIWSGGDAIYLVEWAGGDFEATLECDNDLGDIDLFLWGDDTAYNLLDYSAGPYDTEHVEMANLPAGLYYLHVDGWEGDSNDFTLSVVPEPASFGLLALAALAIRKRR